MKKYLILFSLFFITTGLISAEDYHFVYVENQPLQKICSLILSRIYGKIEIDINLSSMTANRAEKEASTGAVDGEVARITMYGVNNPNLIKVPTPYYRVETMAFVRADSLINDISIEKLADYSVIRIRGIKNTDNLTKRVERVQDFDSVGKMMSFLLLDRADIAITGRINGKISLKKLRYSEIRIVEPPLITNDMYHYIHKDHMQLVPLIDERIKEMVASGELEKLIEEIEESILNGSDFN